MESAQVEAWASVAESVSTLVLALSFCGYLIRQVSKRDDLLFEDWKRQRDKELSKDD